MAITPAGLAAAITAEQGAATNTTIQDEENLKLATAIVNYLIANAQVTVATPGVSPGAAVAAGSGTIS